MLEAKSVIIESHKYFKIGIIYIVNYTFKRLNKKAIPHQDEFKY